jgi:two-component system chemotaxis sensor kinase CheA
MIRNASITVLKSLRSGEEAGKPETGQILLKAYQKGGNVVIEIEDDGQGLNRAKIIKKPKQEVSFPRMPS